MTDLQPVTGKTYTLFGTDQATDRYYATVRQITDELLRHYSMDERQLLEYIRIYSGKKLFLKRISGKNTGGGSILAGILRMLDEALRVFATDIEEHIRTAPVYKLLTDRRLLTIRPQYYLYMTEIELVNRLNSSAFRGCRYKIALLPHCLRERIADCKARPDEIDYVCMGCSETCYVNKISMLLRENNVNPYIWMQVKLSKLFRQLTYQHGQFGVMGVACIVELAWGMKLCMKSEIPVVGLPLNANRCMRWMGNFYPNSIDLKELEGLVK
jgi:hypothetical protein